MSEGKRSVIVTGSNCGLGFECAKQLVKDTKLEWHVVLACRDETKGREALETIIGQDDQLATRISLILLDLADLDSIRNFVQEFEKAQLPPLRALIGNAGLVAPPTLSFTKQGYEVTFGVNHLGHFLLTNLLLPHFERDQSEINSIVIVSSEVHDPSKNTGVPTPRYEAIEKIISPPYETREDKGSRYSTSKLCNILFTNELSKRLEQSDEFKGRFRVNAFNPGFIPETGLARHADQKTKELIIESAKHLRRDLGLSGEQLARLVNPNDKEIVNGAYYDGFENIKSSVESYEVSKQVELWESSKNLLKKENDHVL